MKKLLKISAFLLAVTLIFGFAGCDEDDDGGGGTDGIKWDNDANATLTVINNTSYDMVIFHGQNPSANNLLGGVRGGKSREFNISGAVDDFQVGGYMILRGITLAEYKANKTNLSNAKKDYSAMATYGQGKKFRTEISPNYTGDYAFMITNLGRIGIELRKGSPDGEKIGYLPYLASDFLFYADSTNGFIVYPVYVYYQKSSGQVTLLRPTSYFDTVTVSPRALTGNLQRYEFPNDPNVTWDNIKGSLSSPVAYVTISNNVGNQSAYVTIAGSNTLYSQNGFDTLGSGETSTYEIESTVVGANKAIVLNYYGGTVKVPIEGNTGPLLKNGYDYYITVSGSGRDASNYTATITASEEPRDLSSDIESL